MKNLKRTSRIVLALLAVAMLAGCVVYPAGGRPGPRPGPRGPGVVAPALPPARVVIIP